MAVFSTVWRVRISALVLLCSSSVAVIAQERRAYSPPDLNTVHAVPAEQGMVVAQEKLAAEIGADILRQGGNAVDAAVATGFAMAVTYPRAGNLGGGGFMVIHSAERHEDIAIDYRETAPAAMTRDMFLGCSTANPIVGQVARLGARHRRARHRRGIGAGTGDEIRLGQIHAGGYPEARDRAGVVTASRSSTTSPTRCRHGTRADGALAEFAEQMLFARPTGRRCTKATSPDSSPNSLATLPRSAEQGPRGFYEGRSPRNWRGIIGNAGGIMTMDDLKSYRR